MNLCRGCGEDFAAVSGFDRHRVGPHELPDGSCGRRCLSAAEILEAGMERNERGQWFDPVAAAKVRAAFEGRRAA